jgi:hypothetical protein
VDDVGRGWTRERERERERARLAGDQYCATPRQLSSAVRVGGSRSPKSPPRLADRDGARARLRVPRCGGVRGGGDGDGDGDDDDDGGDDGGQARVE